MPREPNGEYRLGRMESAIEPSFFNGPLDNRIHGLANTGVKYNGRRGKVVEFIRDRGRYLVCVRKGEETEEVSLKRENLTAR